MNTIILLILILLVLMMFIMCIIIIFIICSSIAIIIIIIIIISITLPTSEGAMAPAPTLGRIARHRWRNARGGGPLSTAPIGERLYLSIDLFLLVGIGTCAYQDFVMHQNAPCLGVPTPSVAQWVAPGEGSRGDG